MSDDKTSLAILYEVKMEALNNKSLPEHEQEKLIFNLWNRENKEGGSWINFDYCCDDCDSGFKFIMSEFVQKCDAAIKNIKESKENA